MCIFLLIISDCGSLHDGEVGALLKKTLLSPKVSSFRVGKRDNKRGITMLPPNYLKYQIRNMKYEIIDYQEDIS